MRISYSNLPAQKQTFLTYQSYDSECGAYVNSKLNILTTKSELLMNSSGIERFVLGLLREKIKRSIKNEVLFDKSRTFQYKELHKLMAKLHFPRH